MNRESHIGRDQWPVLLVLAEGDGELREALAHAAGCPGCDRDRGQGLVLLEDLSRLPRPAEPRPQALQRAAAAVHRAMDSEDRVRTQAPWVEALATLGAFGLVIGLAAHGPGEVLGLWGPALVLLGSAAVIPWLVKRFGGWGLGLAAVSLPFALWRVSDLNMAVQLGSSCLAMEVLAAALPLATLASVARARGVGFGPWSFAAAAASGALAGQAALLLTCPSHELGHLVVIHAGIVFLAALVGAGVPKLVPSVARG